eukprot:CAMPEP_0197662092 /NCGR_PEP_ID=MMETSP1338-20131121/52110_1 /TAXON_ID=43686 ORGANISM="Pelagodinium beii, Strain RCC1491" /NCGR_SAMPLE_ID=MMETSP1338 /ASSEMBLY_ACC=CAM_ASM_000754 /LENGTH=67 /DNA_ID=CAMNT_0043239801 /DNA_START=30 /DNA_END=230 /DNA_ORIENTATION=+
MAEPSKATSKDKASYSALSQDASVDGRESTNPRDDSREPLQDSRELHASASEFVDEEDISLGQRQAM